MSYLGGVTSAVHSEEDVALALAAFEDTVREPMRDGLIGRA